MLRQRYRASSASGDQAPQTSSGDQAPKTSHGLTYYRAVDLAKRYQIHVVTIWKWLRSGNLPPPTRLGPNTVAWRSDHIEAWESERSAVLINEALTRRLQRGRP